MCHCQIWLLELAAGIPSLPFVQAHLVELDITTDECGFLGDHLELLGGSTGGAVLRFTSFCEYGMSVRALRFVHLQLPMWKCVV